MTRDTHLMQQFISLRVSSPLCVITVWYTQQEAYDHTGVHHTQIVTSQDTPQKRT